MSFLAPLFLIGAAAIAGPILFHLIRQSVRDRASFSSLMFLLPSPPRLVRRRKLEHHALLALRCLCLLLLAAGFARPFFHQDPVAHAAVTERTRRVVLLDTSASMRRPGLWPDALRIAQRYFENSSADDQIALVVFDRQTRAIFSFEDWASWQANRRSALAREKLSGLAPGWMGTHLGLGLTAAAELFSAESPDNRPIRQELVVITDLQEGSDLDGLQGFDWPRGLRVILERVEPKRRGNAGVQVLEAPDRPVTPGPGVRARVINARDSKGASFRLNWISANPGAADFAPPLQAYVPPGQTRIFAGPALPSGMRAGAVRLSGDEADFDNIAYFAAPESARINIAYIGSERPDDPAGMRFYIERIFSADSARQVQISSSIAEDTTFAIIAAAPAADEIQPIRRWLDAGKTALLVLTQPSMSPVLAALTGQEETRITEAEGSYALLAQMDFHHPVFAPFADPRFSDFSSIHFWRHRRLEIPAGTAAHVMASFDDGAPALAQVPVGKGNLLVFASSWAPADSQLALSSKFPVLIQNMVNSSQTRGSGRSQFLTGEPIPSPAQSGEPVRWKSPDGKEATLAAGIAFTGTEAPGIYVAAAGGRQTYFAVNLPLEESRTASLSPDELINRGVPLRINPEVSITQTRRQDQHIRQEQIENRQKLWRWLIAAALGVTFGEMVLSGWLARNRTAVQLEDHATAGEVIVSEASKS